MKKGVFPARLGFELDHRPTDGWHTAHAGVPLLIEAFRTSGAGSVLDEKVVIKQRKRGLEPSQMVEGLFALWAGGGERCEDLDALRADGALGVLIGHSFPAPQTARDFLEAFDEALPPLWQGDHGASVPAEGDRLQGLFAAGQQLIAFLQARAPCGTATIDIDATILASDKRAARATYQGTTGYQPVIALWAEQDVVLADGSDTRYWAMVTNLPDPQDGSGLDLLRWHRGKAGTVELAHDVLTNELAAEAPPSQKFGANAAWFRLNVMLYNLLSAFKRIAMPPELHRARPKRLRFVLLNTIGKVVRHARETLLRLVSDGHRQLADRARLALAAGFRVPVPQPKAA